MGKYRTIVADPPWAARPAVDNPRCLICGKLRLGYPQGRCNCKDPKFDLKAGRYDIGYKTLSVADIAALPVADLSDHDAHLYLWTTSRFVRDAYEVCEAWGFRYSCMLVWSKPPKGLAEPPFTPSAEFVLFAKRGKPKATGRHTGTVFDWPRGRHSAKPDAFLDIVETVSPGPYVELFARRARFGWDYWGNESLGTASMEAAV